MREYKSDQVISTKSCETLGDIATAGGKLQIVEGHGVEAILDVMSEHEKEPSVQRVACRALSNLAEFHNVNNTKIAFTMDAVRAAILIHKTKPAIQKHGLK